MSPPKGALPLAALTPDKAVDLRQPDRLRSGLGCFFHWHSFLWLARLPLPPMQRE
jgi:hypothetical protein